MDPDNPAVCDVCGRPGRLLVSSLPGIPMSAARCVECVEANAIPLSVALANTVLIGGMENAADWWQEVVEDTCLHVGVPRSRFDQMVEEETRAMDEALAEFEAAERDRENPEPSGSWSM